jgi:signal transduction histidine kinase
MNIFNTQHYALNPYAIAPLLVASLILIFGFFLYYLERQSVFNRSFLFFCVGSALWLYFCSLILSANTWYVALFWSRFLYATFLIVPAAIFHMSVSVSRRFQEQKSWVFLIYALAGIMTIVTQSGFFLEGVNKTSVGFFPKAGLFQSVVLIFFWVCFLLSILNLLSYQFGIDSPLERNQVKLLIFCFVICSFSVMDILASLNPHLYPSGFIAFLGMMIGWTCFKLMYYYSTILKHADNLEHEVEVKTKKLQEVVAELRATQIMLLETGKKSALASLSAGILHQISQPITAIHGFSRFLKKEMPATDQFYTPIYHIEEQSVYLKEMLDDLMNLTRHREIKKEKITINAPLTRSVNLLTDEMRIKRVRCETRLTEDLPLVFADGVHLQQIFMNLITDCLQGLQKLPKDKMRLLFITSYYNEHKKEVIVMIKDNGPGLTDEEKKTIDEPFFTVKEQAIGMGFALCKDLITEHGGRIDVESQENEGIEFTICFPIAESVSVSA